MVEFKEENQGGGMKVIEFKEEDHQEMDNWDQEHGDKT
jgi:hypothetical protein